MDAIWQWQGSNLCSTVKKVKGCHLLDKARHMVVLLVQLQLYGRPNNNNTYQDLLLLHMEIVRHCAVNVAPESSTVIADNHDVIQF